MRALLDTCVLYPTVMREMLIGCAAAGLYEPRWSVRVLEEWAHTAGKLGAADQMVTQGEIARITAQFPRGTVRFDDSFARRFWLPDPADVHVLAAAVAGSCDGIVTMNAKDFPKDILGDAALLRWEPDGFLMILHDAQPDIVRGVAESVLAEARLLSGEDWTMRALMKKARLPRLGKTLGRLS